MGFRYLSDPVMIGELRSGDSLSATGILANQIARRAAFSQRQIVTPRFLVPARPRVLLGGAPGMIWMGVYDPANIYNYNIVVVIQPGPAQGTYICVVNGNTAAPDTGQGWVCLGGDYAAGVWV